MSIHFFQGFSELLDLWRAWGEMNKICFFKGLFGLVLILNVQSFIWDILQDDRAKITILDFGLGPGSLNQFLVTMHLLNLDHQQSLLQLKCGKYFNWIVWIEQKWRFSKRSTCIFSFFLSVPAPLICTTLAQTNWKFHHNTIFGSERT